MCGRVDGFAVDAVVSKAVLLILIRLSPGNGQCIQNAQCSSPLGGLCQCKDGFYSDRGTCKPLEQPGRPCTGQGQCVDNAACSSPVAGVCKCQTGFFNLQVGWGRVGQWVGVGCECGCCVCECVCGV